MTECIKPIGGDIRREGWGGIDGGSVLIGGHTNGDGGSEI